ncbi:glycosyltransferase like family 2-domain-containing protein [Aspergillus filifer]
MAAEAKCSASKPPSAFYPISKFYDVLQYNWMIFPVTQLLVFHALYKLVEVTGHYVIVSKDNSWDWTTIAHFALNFIFLLAQFPPYAALLGLCLPMRPRANKEKPKWRAFKTLQVCLVTKGTNFQTVLNTASHWTSMKHPKVHFYVVADGGNGHKFEGALPDHVTIVDVPNDFQCFNAKYKARALEFFRRRQNLTKDDWVIHLDEESELDDYGIQTCLDFIERGFGEIGMGSIHYNGASHWTNNLMSAGEAMRITEDFGRFQLPVQLTQKPQLGWMHGSWILINGEVENKVTWDTACVAEDFWFAYSAKAMGYKFGWLHAIVREQPPCTVSDFFKQRRRWYTGILSIDSLIVQFMLSAGLVGTACFYLLPLLGFLFRYRLRIPPWYFSFVVFNDAVLIHSMLVASLMQDLLMRDISWIDVVLNAVKTVVLSPIIHFMQAAALVSAFFQPSQGFNVIKKI